MKKKVAMLCSGGVDSSVALSLLHQANKYDITVYYLKIWLEDELSYMTSCPWEDDLQFIKETCRIFNLPLEIVPLQREYWNLVVNKSIAMIKQGLTPNPDIFCNSMIKFGAFFDLVCHDFDYIATGHYAKIMINDDWHYLVHTDDMIKDQTYFLSYTSYEKISRALFPLGVFHNKTEVREYAEKHNLPAAFRKDSQGICFLGKIPFHEFVLHHCGIRQGKLIEYETGKLMGQHSGFWFFTIGQRQGIKLHGGPWFVIEKDIGQNIVYISRNNPKQLNIYVNKIITVSHINFLVPENKKMYTGNTYPIKIRHGQYFNQATLLAYQNHNTVSISITNPDQGIASGQIIAFYSNDNICLASGIITSV